MSLLEEQNNSSHKYKDMPDPRLQSGPCSLRPFLNSIEIKVYLSTLVTPSPNQNKDRDPYDQEHGPAITYSELLLDSDYDG